MRLPSPTPTDVSFEALADRYGQEACCDYARTGSIGPRLLLMESITDGWGEFVRIGPVLELARRLVRATFRTSRSALLLDSLIQAMLCRTGAIHGAIAERAGFHPNFAVQVNLCWLTASPEVAVLDRDQSVEDDPEADPAILVQVHAFGRAEPNCHVIQPVFRTAHFQRYRDQHFRNAATLGRFEIEA